MDSILPLRPTAPTLSLPPLNRLSTLSTKHIKLCLRNLRNLYFSSEVLSLKAQTKTTVLVPSNLPALPTGNRHVQHLIHDTSVPDSGYASAEEDEDEGSQVEGELDQSVQGLAHSDEVEVLELLRADTFERSFAIKWVTGFVSRSDSWIAYSSSDPQSEAESDEREVLLDEAISLLSAFTGSEDEDVALTRTFSFATLGGKTIQVELNDAPLSKEDHTSVGLQSWGSSILLAERMCLEPSFFSLQLGDNGIEPRRPLRILELGAGTGMLSIVAAKILEEQYQQRRQSAPFSSSSPNPIPSLTSQHPRTEIVATDYHPDVLANLAQNIETNFPLSPLRPIITPALLDWSYPSYQAPLDAPFDIILAADVIYHPSHAEWIKNCVEVLLAPGGVFWLIIPVRTTGRHEGMDRTVDGLFPCGAGEDFGEGKGFGGGVGRRLAILHQEEVDRQSNVGRADEGGYRLFQIGWVC